ncbi:MAG: hypothetical protein RLZ62_1410 [Bacteroidota bacterium]|jgi:phage baseplate assembly protein W
MNDDATKSFLGTGWAFPPEFSSHEHQVVMVSGEEDIRQSLLILLSTSPGERLMNPSYGCNLHNMVFERFTHAVKNKISDMVSRSILLFEPRVIVEKVDVVLVSLLEGRINIIVDYTVISTNTRHNIVYPFYFGEGTNLKSAQ